MPGDNGPAHGEWCRAASSTMTLDPVSLRITWARPGLAAPAASSTDVLVLGCDRLDPRTPHAESTQRPPQQLGPVTEGGTTRAKRQAPLGTSTQLPSHQRLPLKPAAPTQGRCGLTEH